jgi:hypothetical protein
LHKGFHDRPSLRNSDLRYNESVIAPDAQTERPGHAEPVPHRPLLWPRLRKPRNVLTYVIKIPTRTEQKNRKNCLPTTASRVVGRADQVDRVERVSFPQEFTFSFVCALEFALV